MIRSYLFTFDPRLTADGVMTLLAGIVAFVAVWFQIRESRKQFKRELKAERDTRAEEESRRQRSIATAILFEFDCFYRDFLHPLRASLTSFDSNSAQLPVIHTVPEDLFPAYVANYGVLGAMPTDLVHHVVRLHASCRWVLGAAMDCRGHAQKSLQNVEAEINQSAARRCLEQIKIGLPNLIKMTYSVCKGLSEFAGIPFEPNTVAVSRESVSQ